MATTQGMVGVIDMPFSAFEDQISSGTMTIDSLFELSQMVCRTSLDPLEQKWTPVEASTTFRGPASGVNPVASSDFCINAVSGVGTTFGASAAVMNPRVIGFVYKGFAKGIDIGTLLQFDCYKNIEWRPQTGVGITVPTPVRTAVVPPYQMALTALDQVRPGWRNSVRKQAETAASKAAKSALAYSGKLLLRNAPRVAGFLM